TLLGLTEAPTADLGDLADRGPCMTGMVYTADASDKLIGRRLHTYQIEAFLGKGGIAKVYLASHLTFEWPCAVRLLTPLLVQRNPRFVNMFFAEARAAASLVHPHVVTIHTIAHDEGLHLIEMEYVPGRSLQSLLEWEKRLDVTLATRYLAQVSSALAVAHQR